MIKLKKSRMKLQLSNGLLFLFLLTACNKEGYNYDRYFKGKEIVYTGHVSNLSSNPGNQRVQLIWTPSADRSIVNYMIYYNNKRDSLTIPTKNETTKDTVKVTISNLGEYVQDFTLHTMDAAGNKSVGQTLTAVKIYGPLYTSSLRNRRFTTSSLNTTNLTLNFAANADTINVDTKVSYTNSLGTKVNLTLHPDSLKIILPNWKIGEKILVRSSYLPVRNAIDVFPVSYIDTLYIN